MKLKELYEMLHTSATPIKVIGSGTGKVLIHHYNPTKHEVFNNLEINGIFPELYLSGISYKDMAMVRLVGWAREAEYKELKEEDNK